MYEEKPGKPTPATGLTSAEAAARLKEVGPNELPRPLRRGVVRILLGVLSEPMFFLLMLSAIIYLAVGGLGEGLLMVGFAGLTILLVVVQEKRSENALEALRALATPSARVLREGREQRISARDVVPGDLLFVADGERVAADALLRRAENISVDESLLTGESMPVLKRADDDLADQEIRMVYASTLVTTGRGLAEVVRTGTNTEAGKIGVSLASIEVEQTLLQKSFGRLVRLFAIVAVFASVLVTLLYGLIHHDWLQATLSGIALGMSALPEEFPMVLAVFVALGARRLARLHVLVRRTAVIEVLGACSTLCVDKTGTLTENRMQICGLNIAGKAIDLADGEPSLPAHFVDLVRHGADASARTSNDPMDAAVSRLAERVLDPTSPGKNAALVREYGLTQDRPAVVRAWRTLEGSTYAAAKGAPETIADMCRLAADERSTLLNLVETYATRGIRVLAVAFARSIADDLPEDPNVLGLTLSGLLAFADPLRESAREAVRRARNAGVAVVMITGDYPATAVAIAREAGIDCTAPAVTGADLARADDETIRSLARTTRVFARVRPDQKLRLVRAFKDNGEVVAMTGDGVNDAPALKAAHIGLAMGGRGTDVAREAASIVLLEDDLGHLVTGIEMGRRIFDNLRKATMYICAIHIPICGLALLPLLLGLPPLLLPLHVVLIEMIIDPICAIAFENEPVEPGTMDQPPRRPDELLLGRPQLALACVQGLLLLGVAFGVYAVGIGAGLQTNMARTMAFIAFTAGNLTLIRVAGTRGWTLAHLFAPGHRAYWTVAIAAVAIVAACIALPSLQGLFQFETPPASLAILGVSLGIASALLFDLAKLSTKVQHVLGRAIPKTTTQRGEVM
ncbi:MAG: cation-translocating P-type ATPase [Dokdonella sp.]